MVCIYCNSPTQVTNSRHQKRNNHIWRRRTCVVCGNMFTTHERFELEKALVLQKGPSSLEPFSKDRLMISIYESCRHRLAATEDAAALTQTVINKLLQHTNRGVINREQLITTALSVLRNFDHAAATVYKAYHPLTRR